MGHIKVLGSSGSRSRRFGTTCFQISEDIVIDAGNIVNSLDEKSYKINHIFLTHAHLDHIVDIPFIIDNCFEMRQAPLNVYGTVETIEFLKNHIFNNKIWPDFSKIKMIGSENYILVFHNIELEKEICINDIKIKAVKADHIEGSIGFMVTSGANSVLISGDTDYSDNISNILNQNPQIKSVFIECSFPNRLQKLADVSRHMTPNDILSTLNNLQRDDVCFFIYHLKSQYFNEIKEELSALNIFENGGKILDDQDLLDINTLRVTEGMHDSEILDRVMDINLKLSSEQDRGLLYEMILTLLRDLTKSDGGTLYLLSEDKRYLDFMVVQNSSLDIFLGVKEQKDSWGSLPLYLDNGEQNRGMVAVVCALDKKIINIRDVYNSTEYNFEGAKKFDKDKNYHSKSMLVVPLTNHENDVIGVVQLINKEIENKNSFFTKYDEKIIKALSLQAAMALTNTKLIESLERFLEAFVTSIANAIDAKSRHTSTHIAKMSRLAPLIANSIHNDTTVYNDVRYSANDLKEIEMAAKLHDIGKISIPEWVIDKSTKLQKLIDGFEIVKLKMELMKQELKIKLLENKIDKDEYDRLIYKFEDDLSFIESSNIGSEFMSDDRIERIKSLSSYKLVINNKEENLLNEDELYNLSIRKGTLTNEERDIMNSHARLSYTMLDALPFPKKYSNVTHIATNHHEKLNGKGYPRGLGEKDLVLEDRILILADVFEALTSSDRPYKEAKKLSEAFRILDIMAQNGEIDAKLLEFFKSSDALKTYCKTELLERQIDV